MEPWLILSSGLAVYFALCGVAKVLRRNVNQDLALERIERKLDLLLSELGVGKQAGLEMPVRVREQLEQGQPIQAIRELREELPSISLREAKDRVDSWAEEMKANPARTLPRPAEEPSLAGDDLPRVKH